MFFYQTGFTRFIISVFLPRLTRLNASRWRAGGKEKYLDYPVNPVSSKGIYPYSLLLAFARMPCSGAQGGFTSWNYITYVARQTGKKVPCFPLVIR